jgi:hypothetical protein
MQLPGDYFKIQCLFIVEAADFTFLEDGGNDFHGCVESGF